MQFENTRSFAEKLDLEDPLRPFRDQFHIPTINGSQAIYLCGNSLGLMPRNTAAFIDQELNDWKNFGVEGHIHAQNPWLYYHKTVKNSLSKVLGTKPGEVVAMGSLTANLHFLFVSFYRPNKSRKKVIMEANAFSSDQYAVASQVKFHGGDPETDIIELVPRQGEKTLRTEDILAEISRAGDELALVFLGGVNYYTGQAFDMKKITTAAHAVGAKAGFDLAHAAGNILLQLHDWQVDFAAWCSYKYLNSGPGGIAGIFVHEKYDDDQELPRFSGWWGHKENERFQMKKGFIPMAGADSWQLSNVPVLTMAAHRASLEIFENAGFENLVIKSKKLTAYLEFLLKEIKDAAFIIITPSNPEDRGAQISLQFSQGGREIFTQVTNEGVIADWREPDVIRVAPVPLYNSYTDVYQFVQILKKAIA